MIKNIFVVPMKTNCVLSWIIRDSKESLLIYFSHNIGFYLFKKWKHFLFSFFTSEVKLCFFPWKMNWKQKTRNQMHWYWVERILISFFYSAYKFSIHCTSEYIDDVLKWLRPAFFFQQKSENLLLLWIWMWIELKIHWILKIDPTPNTISYIISRKNHSCWCWCWCYKSLKASNGECSSGF